MDIYGKLNNETVKKEYTGSTTDTAKVKVDNQSNVISAEVNKVPHKLKIDYWDKETGYQDWEYDGSKEVDIHIPQISDVNELKDRMDTAEGNITTLQNDVSDLKAEDLHLEEVLATETRERIQEDEAIETNAKKITVQDNHNGSFDFTNYEGETTTIQSGYPADEDTIIVNNNTLTAIAIKDETSKITPEDIRVIDSKIHIASKEQMGMVYAWKADDGTVYISLENPSDIEVEETVAPDGSLIYEINTYNYTSQILSDGSIAYIIGE